MYVTLVELLEYTMVLIALATLIITIISAKKK